MSNPTNPKAVLISDIHFTVPTLELASRSLRAAVCKADELKVPLVIAGDTLDSKAIMRGECVNELISILDQKKVRVYVLVGNHDLINEKSAEHTLNFLKPYCTVVDKIVYNEDVGAWLVPYQNDVEKLKSFLSDEITQGELLIIMHQGVQTADMGHYQMDKTSLPKEWFANHRVVSGHYHRRQDIKCGRPRQGAIGLFSYIGNPYTLTFGEADHPAKGFQILHENGILTPVPLNLRKHIVVKMTVNENTYIEGMTTEDIVWIKMQGSYSELSQVNKKELGTKLLGHCNFKLDKIPTDAPKFEYKVKNNTDEQLLDSIIDNTGESVEEKTTLKSLWRQIVS